MFFLYSIHDFDLIVQDGCWRSSQEEEQRTKEEAKGIWWLPLRKVFLEDKTDYFLSHLEFSYMSIPNYRGVWVATWPSSEFEIL